jgi:GNAT superfamily N-acetyltransferase
LVTSKNRKARAGIPDAGFFVVRKRVLATLVAGYVCRVGVLKEHCGHGIQLRLMRAMEARARRNGWKCMVSDTTRNIPSANNFIRAGYRLYLPQYPWAFPDTLYWRKIISPVQSPHSTHSKRL